MEEKVVLEEEVAEITEDCGESQDLPEETADDDVNAESVAAEPTELEKLTAEAEAMKALAQRTQADFDNYRKRNADSVKRARADGKTDAVLEILPVVDNLERAITAISDDSAREGVDKIKKQFTSALEKLGVAEIEAEGLPFNPDLHNAVFTEEVEGVEPDQVLAVLQKGYTLDGKVIRYSMVKVSK